MKKLCFLLFAAFVFVGCSKDSDSDLIDENWYYMPDNGLRSLLTEKGLIHSVKSGDGNYVQISNAGKEIDTLNLNRLGYAAVVNESSIEIGGITVKGDFGYVPNIISESGLSDVDTTKWNAIEDLSGIDAFENLTCLCVNGNRLTSLDLSKNKKLKRLDAEANPLANITLDNPDLSYIDLINSQLSTLDISSCSDSLSVLLVTGYTSLNSEEGLTVSSGQDVSGAIVINHYISASGSILINGSYIISSLMPGGKFVDMNINRPVFYKFSPEVK